tara:strand:+ start:599 stop:832 length:234 start_codon:yes stop_codon:yes gene_type:complete
MPVTIGIAAARAVVAHPDARATIAHPDARATIAYPYSRATVAHPYSRAVVSLIVSSTPTDVTNGVNVFTLNAKTLGS